MELFRVDLRLQRGGAELEVIQLAIHQIAGGIGRRILGLELQGHRQLATLRMRGRQIGRDDACGEGVVGVGLRCRLQRGLLRECKRRLLHHQIGIHLRRHRLIQLAAECLHARAHGFGLAHAAGGIDVHVHTEVRVGFGLVAEARPGIFVVRVEPGLDQGELADPLRCDEIAGFHIGARGLRRVLRGQRNRPGKGQGQKGGGKGGEPGQGHVCIRVRRPLKSTPGRAVRPARRAAHRH